MYGESQDYDIGGYSTYMYREVPWFGFKLYVTFYK